jgi:hypothetical protein
MQLWDAKPSIETFSMIYGLLKVPEPEHQSYCDAWYAQSIDGLLSSIKMVVPVRSQNP